jgi:DNA-binding transcriptional regulator LsrR (DeoR family)
MGFSLARRLLRARLHPRSTDTTMRKSKNSSSEASEGISKREIAKRLAMSRISVQRLLEP